MYEIFYYWKNYSAKIIEAKEKKQWLIIDYLCVLHVLWENVVFEVEVYFYAWQCLKMFEAYFAWKSDLMSDTWLVIDFLFCIRQNETISI